MATALRHGRTSTFSAAPASTKPVKLPAGRAAHERYGVDCGAAPWFMAIIFEAAAHFELQGFLLNRGFSQERNSASGISPNHWCAAHQLEKIDAQSAIQE